jgi:hypothetical protein
MPEIVTKKLGTYIGAEVLDVDREEASYITGQIIGVNGGRNT